LPELDRILLTSALTVLGGVSVYVLGQLVLHFFISPVADLRKGVGEVADVVIFYAHIYVNPGVASKEISDEAAQSLRRAAAMLRVRAHAVPWYRLAAILRLVPRREAIHIASRALIGLSNSVHTGQPSNILKLQDQVRKALSLPEI